MRKLKPARSPVEEAEDALYATFARYGGTHLEGCAHCVSFEESAALRRMPLRKLGTELDRYLFKAMTTWGTEEDFKHFLPRLLELYVYSSSGWLLSDKLVYANWRSWPEIERKAVENYLVTLWRETLTSVGSPLPGNYLLETMLALDMDIAPYDLRVTLDAWRSDPSRDAAQRLAEFIMEHKDAVVWSMDSGGRSRLWRTKWEMADEVREWLLEKATRERLEESFLAYGDVEIARAFDCLEAAAQQK